MRGRSEKAKRYFRWAAVNVRRAASAHGEDLKRTLLRVAAQYRELGEQTDDLVEKSRSQKRFRPTERK
jgi:hypothetical protein